MPRMRRSIRDREIEKARKGIRDRARMEQQLDTSIEKRLTDYRSKADSVLKGKRRGQGPRTILAEGDSWFKYVVGKAIIYYLEADEQNLILNLAQPGDEVSDMLSRKQKRRLARVLKSGPSRNRKFDAFLFSGGGNDLLGQGRFRLWLNNWEDGMTPAQAVNNRVMNAELIVLRARYDEVFELVKEHSPQTRIYLHEYDFAVPNNEGVCGQGPWLFPGLDERGVPKEHHQAVVNVFLKKFAKFLSKIERDYENNLEITVVPTQGTLTPAEWANEIHPRNPGFKKIAGKFKELFEQDLPRA